MRKTATVNQILKASPVPFNKQMFWRQNRLWCRLSLGDVLSSRHGGKFGVESLYDLIELKAHILDQNETYSSKSVNSKQQKARFCEENMVVVRAINIMLGE